MGNVKSKKTRECKRARECKNFDISIKETTNKNINKLDTIINKHNQHSKEGDRDDYNKQSSFFEEDGARGVDHTRHDNNEFDKFVKSPTLNNTANKKNTIAASTTTTTNIVGVKRVDYETFGVFISNSENPDKSTMITIKV